MIAVSAKQGHNVSRVDALMALYDRLEAGPATAATTRARLLEAFLNENEALDPAARTLESAE